MEDLQEFTQRNGMYVNGSKSKVMKFSRSQTHDFPLEVSFFDNKFLEVVSSMKLLGVIVSDSLKWGPNTDYICKRAKAKIWLLRNMKESGLTDSQLVDAYKKEVRSLLELAVPVWNSGLTKNQCVQIERVQKNALSAILGFRYTSYELALKYLGLERLSVRREKICSKFISKNLQESTPLWFPVQKTHDTRSSSFLVKEYQCNTKSF